MSLITHCWQFTSAFVPLGTSHQGGYSHDAVVHAIQRCGIRHIDTAKRYNCESLLQKAIKESGVKREDLWLTTKLWHSDYGYESTKKACLESCERLGVEYLGMNLYICSFIAPSMWIFAKMNEFLKKRCRTDSSQKPNPAFIYTFADTLFCLFSRKFTCIQ